MTAEVGAILGARLLTGDPSPVAIGFSGGGDSLALLLATKAWAATHGRPLLALTVDHGLRPESATWSRFCQDRAAALGIRHRTLVWTGAKPATGLSAAARTARHRLLADAAREAGAAVILMGHTADDGAEAAVMRAAGSTTPSPRVWSPSPVWPQGRDVFLLRPLLGLRRADLRAVLLALGETWIDDPGNVDRRSARARARALIAGGQIDDEPAPHSCCSSFACIASDLAVGAAGDLSLPLDALSDAAGGLGLLGAALLSAAGGERTPRRERVERLWRRLAGREPLAGTLAGCRVNSDGMRAHLVRECSDDRQGALADVLAVEGQPVVWDGRFEVVASIPGARLGPIAGSAARLAPDLRRALGNLPPAARRAVPLATLPGAFWRCRRCAPIRGSTSGRSPRCGWRPPAGRFSTRRSYGAWRNRLTHTR